MTHKAYGEGHAYYVGADMEQAFYDDLFKGVAEEAGVKSLAEAVPEGVSVNVRQSENAEYLFIQNFSRKEVVVPVTGEYQEILLEKQKENRNLRGEYIQRQIRGE